MTFRFVAAAVAVLAVAAPAFATRHADVVYLQQLKARHKRLVEAAKAPPMATPKAPQQEVANAPVAAPARAADDASSG